MKTRKARLRKAAQAIADYCKRHRHKPVREQHAALKRRLNGHMNYSMEGFPRDLYPEGGVDRILEATACQPLLLQLVGERLTQRLNELGRLQATQGDIRRAIDDAYLETVLFSELWRERSVQERALMRKVAETAEGLCLSSGLSEEERQTLKRLERQYYLTERDGRTQVTVPMFRDWIRRQG